MNFCPNCESILYLNLEKKEEDDKTKIYEKCLTCGYNQIPINSVCNNSNKSKICVYNNSITNDGIDNTKSLLDNKYVIKDMTLPRLSNISCINPKCLTRSHPNSLIVINNENINLDKLSDKIIEYLKIEISDNIFLTPEPLRDENLLDYNEIHLKNNVFFDFSKIKKQSVLLKFKQDLSIDKLSNIFSEEKIQFNPYLKDCLIDFNGNDVYISPITTQVVFIKYDTNNMKYMYICSTCSTSWKNIT